MEFKFTSCRQKLTSFKRFSGIQWNFEIPFRCLVLQEKISFDKIFEAVTKELAKKGKQFWYIIFSNNYSKSWRSPS